MAIIGIDLGTTNSLAAVFTGGEPVIIRNAFDEALTPSVVSIDEGGGVFVGHIAKERAFSRPNECAALFKRGMGSKKLYSLGGKNYTPEELSSFIIRKLKADAESFLGEAVTEAVISVPAYFNDLSRKATKAAGELAGLKVERIISEPTAAAIAYGFHNKPDLAKCLVFDLGGGTFDVSILEYTGGVMEVHAVAGDNFLGGEDFNEILEKMFCEKIDIREDQLTAKERASLKAAVEEAKIAFSESGGGAVKWEGREMKIAADDFEKRCQPLLNRLKLPITRAISDAQINLNEIDEIILVGGATRLPIVSRFVSKLFRKFPAIGVNPDEAVALGAAVAAAMKGRDSAIRELILTDVCPFSLGTDVSVRQGTFSQNGVFAPIIERNTVIPASRVERFFTSCDGQRSIKVEILQGESHRAADNIFLGEITVEVPPAAAGQESVDVRYTYDVNGILEAEVTVVSTGVSRRAVIEKNPGAFSKEEIERKLAELAPLKLHPRDDEVNRYALERAERLYEMITGEPRRFLSEAMNAFEAALAKQEKREIAEAARGLNELVDKIREELFDF